jgi:16S rRNA (uracil1498-N3)-methyltransferase
VLLDGAEAKHAISVRRMRVGEGIQLANGEGLRVIGSVSRVDANALLVAVDEVIQEAVPQPSITLVQALAKGDRDEMAVQAGTELGISAVIPWQSDRSVSRWEGAKIAKGVQRWQAIATEAAKQALRAFNPSVVEPVTSKQLANLVSDFTQVLVLDPTAEVGLAAIELPSSGTIAIVVGPEGGITDGELAALEAKGAKRVHLGDSILRTSTAGMAAIAVIESRLGRWA